MTPEPLLFAHIGGSIYQLERRSPTVWRMVKVESWDENDRPVPALADYFVIERGDVLDCDCIHTSARLKPQGRDVMVGGKEMCKHRSAALALGLFSCQVRSSRPAIASIPF